MWHDCNVLLSFWKVCPLLCYNQGEPPTILYEILNFFTIIIIRMSSTSWKCHMVRKIVTYVIFPNARKVGLNWFLETAFANYNFFQTSSAFQKTRNWIGLENKKKKERVACECDSLYKTRYKRCSCTWCSSICALILFLY